MAFNHANAAHANHFNEITAHPEGARCLMRYRSGYGLQAFWVRSDGRLQGVDVMRLTFFKHLDFT